MSPPNTRSACSKGQTDDQALFALLENAGYFGILFPLKIDQKTLKIDKKHSKLTKNTQN